MKDKKLRKWCGWDDKSFSYSMLKSWEWKPGMWSPEELHDDYVKLYWEIRDRLDVLFEYLGIEIFRSEHEFYIEKTTEKARGK